MSVITICEGISGAEEVAGKVAQSLDYACVDREDLVAISEDETVAAIEAIPGVPKVTTDIPVMPRSPGCIE